MPSISGLEVKIGLNLVSLFKPCLGGTLLPRITSLRKDVGHAFGMNIEPLRIHSCEGLSANEFKITIDGSVVEKGYINAQYAAVVVTSCHEHDILSYAFHCKEYEPILGQYILYAELNKVHLLSPQEFSVYRPEDLMLQYIRRALEVVAVTEGGR